MNKAFHAHLLSTASLLGAGSRTTTTSSANALGLIPTPAERAAGRLMRAPDHGDGEGNGGGSGEGDGGSGEGSGDGGGASGSGEGGGGEGSGDGSGEGDGSGGGSGEGDGSIAGDAGKKEGEGGDEGGGEGDGILGAPEAYDLKVPEAAEGMEFDKEVFGLVEPELRALNLSNESAQKLVDAYATKVLPALQDRSTKIATDAAETRAAEIRKEWADQAKGDKEIGGAKFDETVDAVAQVWDKFGFKPDHPFRKFLNESGLGNHPDMLRFLTRVRSVTGEDTSVGGDGSSKDTRPIWDRVYGQPDQSSGGR